MGEPRPLIETDAGDPLAGLVRHAAGLRVEYDVEAGVARHERLVARLEAPTRVDATPSARSWSGWGLASVVAVAAVVAGLAAGPRSTAVELGEPARAVDSDRARTPAVAAVVPRGPAEAQPREPQAQREPDPAVAVASGPSPRAGLGDTTPDPAPPVRARGPGRANASAKARVPASAREPVVATEDDDRIAEEAARIRATRAALARGDAEAALAACDEGDREHPDGVFAAERQGLRVLALVELGRLDAARSLAARYLAAHPSGSLAPRIRRAIELEDEDR